MAWTHAKKEPEKDEKKDRYQQKLHELAKMLRQAMEQDSMTYIEAVRKAGRSGYITTGLTWHEDPEKIDPSNAPDLASQILAEVRVHCEENGPEHYRIVGYHDDDKLGTVECFKTLISKQTFEGIAIVDHSSDERGGEVVATLSALRLQNQDLHKVILKSVDGPIRAIEKCADFVAKAAESIRVSKDNESDQSLQTMMALLAFMERQRDDELNFRAHQNRKDRNADLLAQALKTFGPEVADGIRDLFAKHGIDLPGDDKGRPADPKSSPPTADTPNSSVHDTTAKPKDPAPAHAVSPANDRRIKRDLRYQARLRTHLDGFDEGVSAAVQQLLTEDEWEKLGACARADGHAGFHRQATELKAMLQSRGEAQALALMAKIAKVIPPESTMLLKNLFTMTKDPQ